MAYISEHVGARIRLYRKKRHFTQDDFAKALFKSKSTVSKYERGEIAVDIDTLYEIANVLQIDLRQLIDVPDIIKPTPMMPRGFFSHGTRYYGYYSGVNNSTRIIRNVIDIVNNEANNGFDSIMYTDVMDEENLYQCRNLYCGDVHFSDSFVSFVMQNQDNRVERILINIANTFGPSTVTAGIISGVSPKYMLPISVKILLSQQPLETDEKLLRSLLFGKEDIAMIRKTGCFTVDRMMDSFF